MRFLVFVLVPIAHEFHRPVKDIALALTASLALRPVGAAIFGLMADRWGRRLPLMLDILFYAVIEVLSGLAPNYTVFLILRALSESAWAANGAWARRWRWNRRRPNGAACFRDFCRKVTLSAI